MLSDIEIIDLYFCGGLPLDQAFEAWQRIKAFVEAQNTAHNNRSDEIALRLQTVAVRISAGGQEAVKSCLDTLNDCIAQLRAVR